MDVAVGVEHARSYDLVKLVVVQGALNWISQVDLPCDQEGWNKQKDRSEAIVELEDL